MDNMETLITAAEALLTAAINQHGAEGVNMADVVEAISATLRHQVTLEDLYPYLAATAPDTIRTIQTNTVLFTRPGKRPVTVYDVDDEHPSVLTCQGAHIEPGVLGWRQLTLRVSDHLVEVQNDGESSWMLYRDTAEWDTTPPPEVADITTRVLNDVDTNLCWHQLLAIQKVKFGLYPALPGFTPSRNVSGEDR